METSEAMTICEEEKRLFEEWRCRRKPFVSDGVVSEDDYQSSSPKIAFILKEVNNPNGSDGDLIKFLENGCCTKRPQMWNKVASWVHGMQNLLSKKNEWPFFQGNAKDFRRETLRSVVVMNLKKSPGGSSTDPQVLKAVATEDAPYIKRQYALYDPDITIAGGTGDLFKEVVGHNEHGMEWQRTKCGIRWYYWRNADKYVVSYYHPQYFRLTSEVFCRRLLDAVEEIGLPWREH